MSSVKNIAILGCTGSIGKQTLEVIAKLGDDFAVYALAARRNVKLLSQQIERFAPSVISVADSNNASALKKQFPQIKVLCGSDGICAIASDENVDIVVNAIVGAAGLIPSYSAIASGKRLCTANKESLVIAGELLTSTAAKTGAQIFPIDSEHSALWQAMLSGNKQEVRRLILTASGGPFWNVNKNLQDVSPKDALRHPNWKMGQKITIDSATMMNKALEIIEAHWLFSIPPQKIEVLIHPQSIVHSIVEFIDGSQIAQLSLPDMRLPIQYALTYPQRLPSLVESLNLWKQKRLDFYPPDITRFPAITLAHKALDIGGTAPAIMNAANEIAVAAFLNGKIKFSQIPLIVEDAMKTIPAKKADSLESIMEQDRIARQFVKEKL